MYLHFRRRPTRSALPWRRRQRQSPLGSRDKRVVGTSLLLVQFQSKIMSYGSFHFQSKRSYGTELPSDTGSCRVGTVAGRPPRTRKTSFPFVRITSAGELGRSWADRAAALPACGILIVCTTDRTHGGTSAARSSSRTRRLGAAAVARVPGTAKLAKCVRVLVAPSTRV